MSYSAIVLVPIALIGALVGAIVLVRAFFFKRAPDFGWYLAGTLPLLAANAVARTGLRAATAAAHGDRPMLRAGWDRTVAEGYGLWYAQDAAADFVAWCFVPLGIGALAMVFLGAVHASNPSQRVAVLTLVALSLIMPGRLGWALSKPTLTGTWPLSDPRWLLGYTLEWSEGGFEWMASRQPSRVKITFSYASVTVPSSVGNPVGWRFSTRPWAHS